MQENIASEVVKRIRQGEQLCTVAVEAVSTTWGLLLEDEVVEKIKEDAWHADLKIIVVKANMKKLPIKENLAKVAELKKL